MEKYEKLLNQHFNKENLKPLQKNIIKTIIDENKDCLSILSTGYGKSICYQLPRFIMNKSVIIISPLISLMEDQKNKLEKNNIEVCCLNSNLNYDEKYKIKNKLLKDNPMIVYTTPEYFNQNLGFIQDLDKKNMLGLIAIDECHCISQWGNDFRPEYQKLNCIKDICKNIPILALTATATKDVQKDIIRTIFKEKPIIVKSTFDRPNLKIIVNQKKDIQNDICPLIENNINKKIIIYTRTRIESENIYKLIKKLGIKCGIYHAGLDDKIRYSVQQDFIKGEINCIIATIAFGMGIDQNINLVIRYGMSTDIESYYQEIGRAGRDNSVSECYLFYNYVDYIISKSINDKVIDNKLKKVKENKLNAMKFYVYTKKCRRKYILNYFNEEYNIENCKMCDICLNISNTINKLNNCKYKFKKGEKKDQNCNKPSIHNEYCNQHNKLLKIR